MPLFIRDEGVNDLADKFAKLTGKNKTEAVRMALEAQIDAYRNHETLADRIAQVQEKAAAALGLEPDGWDDKALMDELSGEPDVH